MTSGAAKIDSLPMSYKLEQIRWQFPALANEHKARIFLDNPAGTQVPECVVERMTSCLYQSNANLGGEFETSVAADAAVLEGRRAMADFLNAESSDEIVFGQNMTSLTFHLSRSIGRLLSPGDEIIVSRMDHDANVWPWVMLARDLQLEIRWLPFNTESFEFELTELDRLLNSKTRLVCVAAASNLIGTLNDVQAICSKARAAGAWSYIDAVQSAPHVATDVQALGCDFLACSAYKFFGPHLGILWGRRDILESLEPYKLRPSPDELPWRFETGTQSHEAIAGAGAAIDYFAWIGKEMAGQYHADWPQFEGRRRYVHAAMDCLFEYETMLTRRLLDGLQQMPGVTVQGITDPDAMTRRVPTVSFTHSRQSPAVISAALAAKNIFVWSGHNYAVEVARALGIYESGGAVRIGPVHYNSVDEIDRVLNELQTLLA